MELKGRLYREWSIIRVEYADTISGGFTAEVLRLDKVPGTEGRDVLGFESIYLLAWTDNVANQWIEVFTREHDAAQRLAALVFAVSRDMHLDDVNGPHANGDANRRFAVQKGAA